MLKGFKMFWREITEITRILLYGRKKDDIDNNEIYYFCLLFSTFSNTFLERNWENWGSIP